ncbi:MAG TPA: diguanylate cyclase [Phycisphaerae bacterium]
MDDTCAQGGVERSGLGLRATLFGLQCKSTLAVVAVTLAVAGPIWWLLGRSTAQLTKRIQYEHCTQLAALLARTAAPLIDPGAPGLQGTATDPAAPGPWTRAGRTALASPGGRLELQRLVNDQVTGDPLLFLLVTDSSGQRLAGHAVQAQYLRYLDPRGQAPFSAGPDQTPRVATSSAEKGAGPPAAVGMPTFHAGTDGGPAHLDVVYPIVTQPSGQDGSYRRLGYLRLGLNLDRTMRDLSSAMDLVSGVGIAVVLLTIPLGFLVVRKVVLPLDELSRAMRSFARGDLTARSSVRRHDEIGALTAVFNQMAEQHARTHAEILALNAELEERVQERTRQLRELACRDPLTGLYNRRHLSEVLVGRMAEAQRYDTELACMMIDIDDFKLVNDRLGHAVGDEVLSVTAATILSQLRVADVAARYGGDEFVILLPQTSLEQARFLAERISERLSAELELRRPAARVTLSMGLASRRELPEADAELILQAADRALYDAKGRGKNQVSVLGGDPSRDPSRLGSPAGSASLTAPHLELGRRGDPGLASPHAGARVPDDHRTPQTSPR